MELNKSFYYGILIGSSQAIVGYPLDVLKANLQFSRQNSIINIFKTKKNIKNIFRGVGYPIFGLSIINGSVFGLYEKFYKQTNNHFISGMISGGMSSIIITPFEVCKIKLQTDKTNKLKLFNNKITSLNLYRGFPLTVFLEGVSCGIYFSSYNYLREKQINSFLSGGISGVISWTIIYPIDTIKTRIQSDNSIKYFDAIRKNCYFRGYNMCIIRGFLVNGVSFFLYDLLKNNF